MGLYVLRDQSLRHVLLLSAVIITVGVVYIKAPIAYFCAYDDFIEMHRTAFEDASDPSRILTTPHFNSYRYRPLNRAVGLVTYQIGNINSEFYRVRNVTFHLVNVALVYLLGWKLFGSKAIGAVGAVFFGLHPAANQSVMGAVWTNTIAHAMFLAALLMAVHASEAGKRWGRWIVLAVIAGWLTLMSYDSNIVVFGLMFFWLLGSWFISRQHAVHSRLILVFLATSTILLGLYFVFRHLYVPQGFTSAASGIPSAGVILKNFFMYVGSLLLPLDVVLANEWLNTPLPSEIALDMPLPTIIVLLVAGVCILTGVGFFLWRRLKTSMSGRDHFALIFLLLGIVLPLSPVLLFQSHPSETYLYLPVAFYAVLLSYLLTSVLRNPQGSRLRRFYFPTVLVLVVLFSTATWVRNERVFACGETAERILQGLPHELLKAGHWKISFANMPGEDTTRRYGFYGFRGVDTIGHGATADKAVTSALQLVHKNRALTAEIVGPQELLTRCLGNRQSLEICMLVHSDGRLERIPSSSVDVSSSRAAAR